MTKGKKVIAIVFENPQLDVILNQAFSSDHFDLHKFNKLDDFHVWSKGQQIHGIIAEFKCSMKSSWESRHLLNFLEGHIPVGRVRLDSEGKDLAGQIKADFFQGQDFINTFLSRLDGPEVGRFVRRTERVERSWNVEIVSSIPEIKNRNFVTRDISLGGLFIIHTEGNLKPGHKLWLKILELEDPTPILAEVRWEHPWGKTHSRVPGFGAEFVQMSEIQKNKLCELLGLSIQRIDPELLNKLVES